MGNAPEGKTPDEPGTALEARIQRLEARAAIADVIGRYCIALDNRDIEMLEDVFEPDAVLLSTDGTRDARGREEILAHYRSRFESLGPAMHFTHDHILSFDESNRQRASGVVLAHGEFAVEGTALLAALRYHDHYSGGDDGRWRIASREMSFLYCLEPREYAIRLGERDRVLTSDGLIPAGWPEELPSWRRFYGG